MKRRATLYILAGIVFTTSVVSSFVVFGNIKQQQPVKQYTITPATPPNNLTGKARTEYFTLHYWDNFDFQDLGYLRVPETMLEGFQSYVVNFKLVEPTVSRASIQDVISKAAAEPSGDMLYYFLCLFEDSLYDPNSPFRNEELYITVLEQTFAVNHLDSIRLVRSRHHYEMAQKNRIGHRGSDFGYTLDDGKTGSLYDIRTPFTLVIFHNPDCRECESVMFHLAHNPDLKSVVDKGKLTVLTIYPDNDLEVWQEHLTVLPGWWVNGYDQHCTINEEVLYDIRAIPSLYLFDNDKRVILKDAEKRDIEIWLRNHL